MSIYAAFPGTGKTYIAERNPDVLDSDSSKFKTPDWPESYLDHIEQAYRSGAHHTIFCSTHREVLDGLYNRGLPFILVYPDQNLKFEYMERYRKRGSPEEFVALMGRMWDRFMHDLLLAKPEERLVMWIGQYLSDVIGWI